MGYLFEELIRRFSEQSNETAGDHFTPREVIRLMVNLLLGPDAAALGAPGVIRTVYDPACGTGGMLTVAKDHILATINPHALIELFGQELNPKSYAIRKADMLVKGERDTNIKQGNSFDNDQLAGNRFDYLLSNPPFGVEWKKVEAFVRDEAKRGFAGRFGAGLPRVSDGSLLFLQHLVAKMSPPDAGGGRIAIVFNGSPLFTGDAGGSESEIRRWLIERDWLEAIVALPDQLFYNTGIATYVWIVTNRKEARRAGKVQLVDATGFCRKMRKSLRNKRHEISPEQIEAITAIYGAFAEGEHAKIFANADFGYRKVTIERPLRVNLQASPERIARLAAHPAVAGANGRAAKPAAQLPLTDGAGPAARHPILDVLAGMDGTLYRDRPSFERALDAACAGAGLALPAPLKKAVLTALSERDETAAIVAGKGGAPEPDPDLRDTENVPLGEDVRAYVAREVLPHVPDAWINESVRDERDGGIGKVGYEIPFTRAFYRYQPLRPLAEIDAELKALEAEILTLLGAVTA